MSITCSTSSASASSRKPACVACSAICPTFPTLTWRAPGCCGGCTKNWRPPTWTSSSSKPTAPSAKCSALRALKPSSALSRIAPAWPSWPPNNWGKGEAMAAIEPEKSNRPDPWRGFKERRFGILLVILAMLLAGLPILIDFGLSGRWFDALMSLLMLAAILPLCFERRQRLLAVTLGIPTILFSIGGHALSGTIGAWLLFIARLCETMFFLGAAGLIVRSLFNLRDLTVDSIFGAVCGYVFLGLGWAVLYSMIEEFRPGSFDVSRSLVTNGEPVRMLPQVLTYFSFVTLTTVGYGDVNPVSATARTFAWIEAVSGQFYLAVVVAGLVSLVVAKRD